MDTDLPVPPLLTREHALFLDVDGTLLELADSPSEVIVPATLAARLETLRTALDGALAVISGRSLAVIDELLQPWRATGAGVHGAELRLRQDAPLECAAANLQRVAARLRDRLREHTQILVEDKGVGVAVHYARAPELQAVCESALRDETAHLDGLRLQRGRSVLEAVPAQADKGAALMRLLADPPFQGRAPVFVGDDHTDEAAFAVLHDRPDGLGIKVGTGPTRARYRLGTPAQVLEWLDASLDALQGPRT